MIQYNYETLNNNILLWNNTDYNNNNNYLWKVNAKCRFTLCGRNVMHNIIQLHKTIIIIDIDILPYGCLLL